MDPNRLGAVAGAVVSGVEVVAGTVVALDFPRLAKSDGF